MNWSVDELRRIVEADDLKIAPFREDGTTYGTPTWIWCVAVDGEIYVRAYNGPKSRWYQAAMRQQEDAMPTRSLQPPTGADPPDTAAWNRRDLLNVPQRPPISCQP